MFNFLKLFKRMPFSIDKDSNLCFNGKVITCSVSYDEFKGDGPDAYPAGGSIPANSWYCYKRLNSISTKWTYTDEKIGAWLYNDGESVTIAHQISKEEFSYYKIIAKEIP